MLKVYVTDFDYPDLNLEHAVFDDFDCEFKGLACKSESDVINLAKDADAIIVQYAAITKRVMENLKNLKIIVRYGVGVDTIDLDSARKLDIIVCNVPDYGVEEVSSHAITMVMCCLRKITMLNDSVKAGKWDYTISVPIRRTTRLTIGFAAFGRIAQMTSQKAAPFGFKMISCDPFLHNEVFERNGVSKVSFDELLEKSDIISCHMPLNRETRHIFSDEAFGKMKKGVIFVNTSRGGLVDETALIKALENKIIGFAALDVCEKEPIDNKNPLLNMENVIITPHAAWYSEESALDLRTNAAKEVVRVLSGNAPLNPYIL